MRRLKKIKTRVLEARKNIEPKSDGCVRLMFQDEAGFGRINKPKRCWCSKKIRPSVPCHHIREYVYAFGAVEPVTGENFFLVLPRCNTGCMNVFHAEYLGMLHQYQFFIDEEQAKRLLEVYHDEWNEA